MIRDARPDERPYVFDYALGRLEVLADRIAEERSRPIEDRATEATDDALDRVAGHVARSRQTLEAGHVDLAEMHFDQITPIVTHTWRYDAALSNDLLEARRGFFGSA